MGGADAAGGEDQVVRSGQLSRGRGHGCDVVRNDYNPSKRDTQLAQLSRQQVGVLIAGLAAEDLVTDHNDRRGRHRVVSRSLAHRDSTLFGQQRRLLHYAQGDIVGHRRLPALLELGVAIDDRPIRVG